MPNENDTTWIEYLLVGAIVIGFLAVVVAVVVFRAV